MVTKKGLTFCLVTACFLFVATIILVYITDMPSTFTFNMLCFLLPATVFSAFMLAIASLFFASKEFGRVHEEESKKIFMGLQTFSNLPKELQTKEALEKILKET